MPGQPFAKEFLTQVLARDFYVGVRCGLVHEARTKDGWTIWGSDPSGKIICSNNKVVYRDNFQSALLEFIDWYESALISDVPLQEAFVRKFDSLCV